jgi:glycosyltransferase involved in cell wall biosynthesis
MGPAGEQSGIAGGSAVGRAAGAVEGWAARRAAGVGVVAEAFRPYLESKGVPAERIESLPNWSHVASPSRPRAATRADLGWAPGETVVLHAGNMGLKQGLEQVVAAARVAVHQQPRFRFVLMGDGNQRRAIEQIAAGLPNVAFLDPQPAERFSDILHAADVLLVTQRASVTDMSLPSKLTSYFVARRPVVAAVDPASATARLVEQSGGGLVVRPDDPSALLRAITRVTDDDTLAERLSEAGHAYAAEHLSAERSLERVAGFVETLIAGRRIAGRQAEATVAS